MRQAGAGPERQRPLAVGNIPRAEAPPRIAEFQTAECAAGLALANCSLQGPNSDQVPIVDVADIIRAQRNKRLSSAGGCDELNLEVVRVMDLDNRAWITDAKASLRYVTLENNGIEKAKHRL